MLVLALVPPGGAAAAATPAASSWAGPEIKAVTAAGLMDGKGVASFRPQDPLTAQALENLVFALKQRLAPPQPEPPVEEQPVDATTTGTTPTVPTATTTAPAAPLAPKQLGNPDRPVTMSQLDTRLVQALDLQGAAQLFTRSARAAGLQVPARFGAEVVARLLGLRTNHPAAQDALELLPGDAATRAEAAFSAARILRLSDWDRSTVEALAAEFALPAFTDWQRRILDTAVARIGMPYIWGGESDGAATAFGVASRGGYDCSGFVWRVYKTQPYPGGGLLPTVLRGRTTYQMSGEVPRPQRIGRANLEPADVIFFGSRGPQSQPSQVDHMGIYLGNGWFIHSSGFGVALATLDGWYERSFAWGRRPLREAGLQTA